MKFAEYCHDQWAMKYGTKPPWGKKDYILLAEARKLIEFDLDAEEAWDSYLDSKDPFYSGHPPNLFRSSISKWFKPRREMPVPPAPLNAKNRAWLEAYNDSRSKGFDEMRSRIAAKEAAEKILHFD